MVKGLRWAARGGAAPAVDPAELSAPPPADPPRLDASDQAARGPADEANAQHGPSKTPRLDTLAEAVRELEKLDTPRDREMEKTDLPRLEDSRTEPVASREGSAFRRVFIGLLVAVAYGGILAVAGLFISRAVNSVSDRTAGGPAAIAVTKQVLSSRDEEPAPQALAPTPAPVPTEPAPVADATSPPPEPPSPPQPSMPAAAVPVPASPSKPDARSPDATSARASGLAASSQSSPAAASTAVESPRNDSGSAAAGAAPPVPPSPPATADAATASSPVTQSAALAPPANVLTPPPSVLARPSAPPPSPEAEQLRALGDERLNQGDIATARLFYERAADAGDGEAALSLGNTYDPAYLAHWGVLGMQGDVATAARWYRRARELGESEADQDLDALPRQ